MDQQDTDGLPFSYRQNFTKLKRDVEQIDRVGFRRQPLDFVEGFAAGYLYGLGILSRVRANPVWRKQAAQFQALLIRANVLLYPEEKTTGKSVWHAIWTRLPAQLWADRLFYLAALAIIVVTAGISFVLVLQDFELASLFMSSALRSHHDIEAYLFSDTAQQEMLTGGRQMDPASKGFFAGFLMVNNIRVALMCFVSGFIYGIPTLLLLVQTGLMLGTLPALFYHGHFIGIWAWLLPHGVPEISAIIFAGGAGLKIGLAMLAPGDLSTGRALRQTIRAVSGTMAICVVLLIWAGVVESFIRQSTLSDDTRLTIAAISVVPILAIFIRAFFAHQEIKRAGKHDVKAL